MRKANLTVHRAGAFGSLLQDLFAVARAHDRWNEWLSRLCAALRCNGATLTVHQSHGPSVLGTYRSSASAAAPGGTAVAAEQRHLVDLLCRSFDAGRLPDGAAPAASPRPRVAAPDQAGRWLPGAVDTDEFAATLELILDTSRIALGPDELDLLDAVAAHLQEALSLQRHVAALHSARDSLVAIIDRLALAVIAVNGDERVVFANGAARVLLERGDALRLHRQTLVGTTAAATAELRKLIGAVVHMAINDDAAAGSGAMRLIHGGAETSLKLVAVPVNARGNGPFSEPVAAVLFVGDTGGDHAQSARIAAEIFGLTNAETRVLAGLISGESLERIAKQSKLSTNTIRSQLQHIFNKTNTHNQTDLVRSVLSIPAVRS